MFKKSQNRPLMIGLLLAASVGLVASFVLSYEALILAANSSAILSCDLNAVISCAAVANHWSASLLGVPNSFFGLIAMPVIMTIAVSVLAGVKFPRWFMQFTQVGVIGGLLFAAWMFYMSYAVIGILCPWCLTVDVAMVVIFFTVTRYNIINGIFSANKGLNDKLLVLVEKGYDQLILWSVIVLMIVSIILKFGSELLGA